MKRKLTHCITLRTLPELDLLISDAAYDARLSKAAWIRWAIERCLKQKQQRHEAVLR